MTEQLTKMEEAGREQYPAVAAALVFLAAGLPIIVAPGGYLGFAPVRQWLLVSISLLAVVILFAYWIKRRKAILLLTGAEIPWAALLLVLLVSTLLSKYTVNSAWGSFSFREGLVSWAAYFMLFFLAAQAFRNERARGWLVRALKYSSVVIAAYGVLQFAGLDPLKSLVPYFHGKASSFLGSPAYLGGYLVLVAPVFLCLAANPEAPKKERRNNSLVFVFLAFAVVLTVSRAAWVALALVVALVVSYALYERGRTAAKSLLVGFGGVLLVVVIIFGIASGVSTEFRKKTFLSLDDIRTRASIRTNRLSRALSVIADMPLIGHGPGTYEFVFPDHIDASWEKNNNHDPLPEDPGNIILGILASAGLAGLAAFAWLILSVSWLAAKRMRLAERQARYLMGGFLLGGLGYLAFLLFNSSIIATTALFWLFAGCALGMPVADKETLEQENKPSRWAREIEVPRGGSIRLVPLWLALAATALLCSASLVFLMRPVIVDIYLGKAMDSSASGEQLIAAQYASRAASLDARYGVARLVEGQALLEKAVSLKSTDLFNQSEEKLAALVYDYPDWEVAATTLGSAYLSDFESGPRRRRLQKMERIIKGKPVFEAVVRRDPEHADAQFKLARFEMYSTAYDRALNRLEKVFELKPDWPEPYNTAGNCYLWKGEPEKASEYFQKAQQLSAAPSR